MTDSTTHFQILARCAAAPGSPGLDAAIANDPATRPSWEPLCEAAEHHGLEPLLLTRLQCAGVAMPPSIALQLRGQWTRHAHAAGVRARVMGDVARAFEQASIPFLVLKGAALAQLVYDTPSLRPMRDVDLLLRVSDLRRADALLRGAGFAPIGQTVAPGYHHLQALSMTVDGAAVTIELHGEILRRTAFIEPERFDDLRPGAQSFEWGGRRFLAPGREDMLWHVYAHAFAINALRPGIRLISVADLTHATRMWIDALDWPFMRRRRGRLLRALILLHQLTPWPPAILDRLHDAAGYRVRSARHDVRRTASLRPPVAAAFTWRDVWRRDVLWPRDWWFRMRYGIDGPARWLWYRGVGHPARLCLSAADTAGTRFRKRAQRREAPTPAASAAAARST